MYCGLLSALFFFASVANAFPIRIRGKTTLSVKSTDLGGGENELRGRLYDDQGAPVVGARILLTNDSERRSPDAVSLQAAFCERREAVPRVDRGLVVTTEATGEFCVLVLWKSSSPPLSWAAEYAGRDELDSSFGDFSAPPKEVEWSSTVSSSHPTHTGSGSSWRDIFFFTPSLLLLIWMARGWRRAPAVVRRPALLPLRSNETKKTFRHGPPVEDSGTWQGIILDLHTRAPIKGALVEVTLNSFADTTTLATTSTGQDGTFVLRTGMKEQGGRPYRLRITAPWHRTFEGPLPSSRFIDVALIDRRRALLDRLVRKAQQAGGAWITSPEPTPAHVARAAEALHQSNIARWARTTETVAFGPVPVDAGQEAMVVGLETELVTSSHELVRVRMRRWLAPPHKRSERVLMIYIVLALVVAVLVVSYVIFARRGSKQIAPQDPRRMSRQETTSEYGATLQQKLQDRRTSMAATSSPSVEEDAGSPADEDLSDEVLEDGTASQAKRFSRPPPPHLSSRPPPPKQSAQSLFPPSSAGDSNVGSLRKGLVRARGEGGVFGRIVALLQSRPTVDLALIEELENVLISCDVGVKGTEKILQRVRKDVAQQDASNSAVVWDALRSAARDVLHNVEKEMRPLAHPTVILMVGVNGAGKTTTIGKLATKLQAEGRKVLLAAGDTFRAAAVQQLDVWGQRAGCEVVKGREGADASSVAFEAIKRAQTTGVDVVLVDTAGRLQTKTPLMDELRKMAKTLGKAMDGAPHETWLVIDATTGQNGLSQAKQFGEALPLSGIVLTKLDGTAKGGIVLSICEEMSVPVRYVGLGERSEDLHGFVAEEFVEALFGEPGRTQDAA